MNIDRSDFLHLSSTQHRRTVTIQTPFLGATASQLLRELELLALAMGYTEKEWHEAILGATSPEASEAQ